MDKAQLLVLTRNPDFLQRVEILGYFVLTFTALALFLKITKLAERKAYFIAAFALAPLLVFNQQVLTGKSLQPFHYEFYVINYVVLLGNCLDRFGFLAKNFGKVKTAFDYFAFNFKHHFNWLGLHRSKRNDYFLG